MLWVVYNILFSVGYVMMLPHFLLRMRRRGGYRKGFLQRVAVYPAELKQKIRERRRIWIHAVSVGEIYVALRYMREMREQRPDLAFVLSTTTSTGHRVAESRLSEDDVLLYYPADFPCVVRHALRTVDPVCLVLTESEIWPNMIRAAARRGAPVVIINGRISHSSHRGYRLLKVFFSKIIRLVDLTFVQTEGDRQRLIDLGGNSDRIQVAGSAKYDVADAGSSVESPMDAWLEQLGWSDRLVLLGGSTWQGEESVLADIYMHLRNRVDNLRLILAPRHAERGDEVESALGERGLKVMRRSRAGSNSDGLAGRPDVVLVDTTGELMSFYACADVIFIGKSLTNHGGQNIIEPAVFGKAVVVGPNMENFPDVMGDFMEVGALVQVKDAAELERALGRLLDDAEERAALGERARQVVEAKRGVVRDSVRRIVEVLN